MCGAKETGPLDTHESTDQEAGLVGGIFFGFAIPGYFCGGCTTYIAFLVPGTGREQRISLIPGKTAYI